MLTAKREGDSALEGKKGRGEEELKAAESSGQEERSRLDGTACGELRQGKEESKEKAKDSKGQGYLGRDPRWRGIGLLVDQRPGVPLCRGQSGRYGRTARRTVTAAASLPQGRGRAIRAILGNWSGSILSILRLVPTQVPEIAG